MVRELMKRIEKKSNVIIEVTVRNQPILIVLISDDRTTFIHFVDKVVIRTQNFVCVREIKRILQVIDCLSPKNP